jgi:hypothetical protein
MQIWIIAEESKPIVPISQTHPGGASPEVHAIAQWFPAAVVLFIILGLVLPIAPWLPTWFGRLPGDMRYESARSRVFVPVTSMIVVSIILTLFMNLFLRR